MGAERDGLLLLINMMGSVYQHLRRGIDIFTDAGSNRSRCHYSRPFDGRLLRCRGGLSRRAEPSTGGPIPEGQYRVDESDLPSGRFKNRSPVPALCLISMALAAIAVGIGCPEPRACEIRLYHLTRFIYGAGEPIT